MFFILYKAKYLWKVWYSTPGEPYFTDEAEAKKRFRSLVRIAKGKVEYRLVKCL